MAKCFLEADASLDPLRGRTVAVIGYGNQGRSQARNLRDSGIDVIVGNRDDEYRAAIANDGFEILDIVAASSRADVLMLILPDEVQAEVYERDVAPRLRQGATLCFSHGYTIHFGLIAPRTDLDVVLVAPKMIGEGVRTRYVDGRGFASLVGVHQDVTGQALKTALAIANGIGGARLGAWQSTFEEETVTDLYGEQTGGASMLGSMMLSFETLVEAGYDPDVVALEMYASGELGVVMQEICAEGILRSLRYHSPASRYGQLSRAPTLVPPEAREGLKAVLENIRSGAFAKELAEVEHDGHRRIDELTNDYARHPLFAAESRVLKTTAPADNGRKG
jgi:ketol-acid reductoisomerase